MHRIDYSDQVIVYLCATNKSHGYAMSSWCVSAVLETIVHHLRYDVLVMVARKRVSPLHPTEFAPTLASFGFQQLLGVMHEVVS
eukprot:m.153014 g.153014  ORF g.153014 m.153014 type:complete len:84 (-) comp14277_c1_seq1:441-692(-)